MPKFILAQVQHFKWDISGFDNDIQAFHQECSDTILSFNKEYMELMRSVKEDNLNDFAIRSKIQDLAKKRRTHTFS